MRSKTQEDRSVEIGNQIADDRLKEMIRTYEAYGNWYGREDIARMLEEEGYDNREEIPKAVGSEALVRQERSGNRNGSGEESLHNLKPSRKE